MRVRPSVPGDTNWSGHLSSSASAAASPPATVAKLGPRSAVRSAREGNVSVSLSRPQNGARGRGGRNLVRGVLRSSTVALTPPFPSVMPVHDMPLRSLGRSIGGKVRIPDPRVRRETPARPAAPVARSRRQFSSRSASSTDPPVVGSRRGRNARSQPKELRVRKRKAQPGRPQHGGQGGPVARLGNRVARPLQRTHSDLIFAPRRRQFEKKKDRRRQGAASHRLQICHL